MWAPSARRSPRATPRALLRRPLTSMQRPRPPLPTMARGTPCLSPARAALARRRRRGRCCGSWRCATPRRTTSGSACSKAPRSWRPSATRRPGRTRTPRASASSWRCIWRRMARCWARRCSPTCWRPREWPEICRRASGPTTFSTCFAPRWALCPVAPRRRAHSGAGWRMHPSGPSSSASAARRCRRRHAWTMDQMPRCAWKASSGSSRASSPRACGSPRSSRSAASSRPWPSWQIGAAPRGAEKRSGSR
mmetsp:Transcript_77478/g.250727  ORF Transcript_77478/g.250727 Transcript_77478/m.250727 type:complete len:250 (+) Transcript_77478:475-1224(+)